MKKRISIVWVAWLAVRAFAFQEHHIQERVLSPCGKWAAVCVSTSQEPIAVGSGDVAASELWLVKTDGSEKRCLLKAKSGDTMADVLAGMHSLAFSPEGETLYFLSNAWVTSDALHGVDLSTGEERFVSGANWYEVIATGKYRGHLLVSKHNYFLGGGSYDWIWLLTSSGTEIGPVADGTAEGEKQLQAFKSMFE